MNHAIRITLPFADCSGIIRLWSERCHGLVAYQHDADEEISKTHVHLVMYHCEVQVEALKRMWKPCPGKGNEFWSFKKWDSFNIDTIDTVPDKFITYMTKGTLAPVFNKNFSPDILESSRQAWVDPVVASQLDVDSTQYYINEVLDRFRMESSYDYIEHYRHECYEYSNTVVHSMRDYLEFLLSEVRTCTMKIMWYTKRRTPPASLYKTVAGSVFLRLAERFEWLDTAIDVLTQKWY